MKVHVNVDETIYPELHKLLEATPVSKRARVLANLAFKACLLSNVALANSEQTAPSKGRNSSDKKKKSTEANVPASNKNNADTSEVHPKSGIENSTNETAPKTVSEVVTHAAQSATPPSVQTVEGSVVSEMGRDSGNEQTVNLAAKTVTSDGMGMPEKSDSELSTSGQQNNADGDRGLNVVAQQMPVRKRRVID
ncbi:MULTISPECIES: hypothetical protein [Enterobacterales]|uniref:Uncharacterized protein n=7 Tax=Enterobacterales TaxID=91347 RepID=A0A7L8KAE6_ECOLX|nr:MULTISPECIES: hypothetical protein [Enterobacterales]ELB1214820.1 hypothetical protein [Proteus mirabilis]ELY4881463.1 hypothetical protein [Morganella morganii]SPY66642.1 Uncharacterised protein [Providencia stuartii]ELR5094262.1 hypothetical protein [Providencia rettgeri]ELR5243110.1 hypothetical protein [Providencia rettgeri]